MTEWAELTKLRRNLDKAGDALEHGDQASAVGYLSSVKRGATGCVKYLEKLMDEIDASQEVMGFGPSTESERFAPPSPRPSEGHIVMSDGTVADVKVDGTGPVAEAVRDMIEDGKLAAPADIATVPALLAGATDAEIAELAGGIDFIDGTTPESLGDELAKIREKRVRKAKPPLEAGEREPAPGELAAFLGQ